jgi:predicted dehydrogenase
VLDHLRCHESAELVAIAERSGRLRMAAEGRFRVPVYPRLARLLTETPIDAVLVATANGDKAAIVQEALRAGKHALVHAPLAVSREQIDKVEAAQPTTQAAVVTLVPLRYTPAYADLQEAVAQGLLGRIDQAIVVNSQKITATPRTQAFYDSRTHGGLLTGLAVHDLDLLGWLCGEVRVTTATTLRSSRSEHPHFENSGLIRCSLKGGGEGVIACNWLAPDAGAPFHELTLIGTEGSAWISGGKSRALGEESATFSFGEAVTQGYMTTHSQAGLALPRNAADHSVQSTDAAMLNAAIQTLADPTRRAAATADAFRTARAAVTAQDIARQEHSA